MVATESNITKYQGKKVIAILHTRFGNKLGIITDFGNNNIYEGRYGTGVIKNFVLHNRNLWFRLRKRYPELI